MKFGIRKWLEPGEAVLYDSRGATSGFQCVAVVSIALGVAIAMGFMVSAFMNQTGLGSESFAVEFRGISIPGEHLMVLGASGLAYVLVMIVWKRRLEPHGVQLTDRRLIRLTGKYRWPLEALAFADIAEVRTHGSWIALVANGPDAIRRLNRKGGSVPAGKDRFGFQASRWKLFGSGETRNEKALRIIGREPLRWHAPALPRDVERLVSLEAKFPVLVYVLAFIPMVALGIAVMFRLHAVQVVSDELIFPAALASMMVPLVLIWAGCHLYLWWAARRLTPEKTALFLRATVHPDWGPGRWTGASDIAARRAALKRRERFFSWLAGRPIRCEDAPGPEAFGGGWVT